MLVTISTLASERKVLSSGQALFWPFDGKKYLGLSLRAEQPRLGCGLKVREASASISKSQLPPFQ